MRLMNNSVNKNCRMKFFIFFVSVHFCFSYKYFDIKLIQLVNTFEICTKIKSTHFNH